MAFVIRRICYVCVFYLFLLCVIIQATTKRTAFPNGDYFISFALL